MESSSGEMIWGLIELEVWKSGTPRSCSSALVFPCVRHQPSIVLVSLHSPSFDISRESNLLRRDKATDHLILSCPAFISHFFPFLLTPPRSTILYSPRPSSIARFSHRNNKGVWWKHIPAWGIGKCSAVCVLFLMLSARSYRLGVTMTISLPICLYNIISAFAFAATKQEYKFAVAIRQRAKPLTQLAWRVCRHTPQTLQDTYIPDHPAVKERAVWRNYCQGGTPEVL